MIKKIVVGNYRTNCYIIGIGKKECIIIDPGANGELIEKEIINIGLSPKLIIFTHGHLDHINAADYLIDTFSKSDKQLPIAASKKDSQYFGSKAKELHRLTFNKIGFKNDHIFECLYSNIPELDFYLSDGDTIEGTDFQILETPGHTPGSISIYSKINNVIFTGDCVMIDGIGRTDLPGGDYSLQESSIYNVILKQDDETQLMAGHGRTGIVKDFKTHHNSNN